MPTLIMQALIPLRVQLFFSNPWNYGIVIRSVLTLLILLISRPALAAITFNSVSSTNGEALLFVCPHTVNSGSGRMLIVGVHVKTSSATVVAGVTFNAFQWFNWYSLTKDRL